MRIWRVLHDLRLAGLASLVMIAVGPESARAQQQQTEVLPNLWVAERLELGEKVIERGMARSEVLDALGKGYKTNQKLREWSAQKFKSDRELVLRLAPWEAPFLEYADKLAIECGEHCWVEGFSKKIGKKTEINVALMGTSKTELRVSLLVVNRGHSPFGLRRALADAASGARYVVTDDQVYRISQIGPMIRVEKIK